MYANKWSLRDVIFIALISVFFGFIFWAWAFGYNVIQGFGTELGFAVLGYRRWDKTSLSMSVITVTIVTFIWDLFRNGYADYSFGLLIGLFITRLISAAIFAGVIVYFTQKLVAKSGILEVNKNEVVS